MHNTVNTSKYLTKINTLQIPHIHTHMLQNKLKQPQYKLQQSQNMDTYIHTHVCMLRYKIYEHVNFLEMKILQENEMLVIQLLDRLVG
jgi:hypothetical protein